MTINDDQGNLVCPAAAGAEPARARSTAAWNWDRRRALGYYYINIRLDERDVGFGVGFQVAEYRKPEYEISAETDKPEYIQGEQIQVTGAGRTTSSAGRSRTAKVRWMLTSADAPFDYKGEGWYSFADFDWWEPTRFQPFGGMISQGDGRDRRTGRSPSPCRPTSASSRRSQRFTFDITMQDVNNQAVSTQATAVVHKGEFYIGAGAARATCCRQARRARSTCSPSTRRASPCRTRRSTWSSARSSGAACARSSRTATTTG